LPMDQHMVMRMQAPARLTCHSVHSAIVSLLRPHDSANMRQPIQPHPVSIFVRPLRLHLQGIHTGEALLCGDVLGVLLTKNALGKLSGCPFLPWAILLRLEDRILACWQQGQAGSGKTLSTTVIVVSCLHEAERKLAICQLRSFWKGFLA